MFDDAATLAHDPDKLLSAVAHSLAATGDLHRLFDLRLLQERRRLGLALDRRTPADEVEEPLRSQLEASYLTACREVGELLLDAGRIREAWMYLRPAGDKLAVRRRLARMTPADEQLDELIELALFELVDPERGYAWLLSRQGTCSAITTLDGIEPQLSVADVRSCAAVLLRHMYRELEGNLRGHLHRLGGAEPAGISVLDLIRRRPDLQMGGNYHLDPSHLAAAMRYARLIAEPALASKALEMAEYGAGLPTEMQYPGESPFEELYPAHRMFFQSTLGRDVEAALAHFGPKAHGESSDGRPLQAAETYIVLLARAGRAAEALEAYRELVPGGRELSRYAPTPLELAERSGHWTLLADVCRQRGDLVGFAAGLLAQHDSEHRG